MARFDVYANPGGAGYVLDVQADLLDALNTRVVVPLMAASDAPAPAKRLNPIFTIGDEAFVLVPQFMAAIPQKYLRHPITSLALHDSEIMAALDMLLVGF